MVGADTSSHTYPFTLTPPACSILHRFRVSHVLRPRIPRHSRKDLTFSLATARRPTHHHVAEESHWDTNTMNSVLLQFANGQVLFFGFALCVPALLLLVCYARSRVVRSILRLVAIFGALLVLLSATPFPSWVYAVWLTCLSVAVLVPDSEEGDDGRPRRRRRHS
jgi:lysylphosphatidylglycerol synthetase-like protein (DUF2156 family)